MSQIRKFVFALARVAPGYIFIFTSKQVLEAGANSIAVISAITKADDVGEAVRQWGDVFEASSSSSSLPEGNTADGTFSKDGSPSPRTASEILEEQRYFGVA